MVESAEDTAEMLGRKWRLKYATLIDRSFASTKIDAVCGHKIIYTPMKEGLKKCLSKFLDGDRSFKTISWKNEAYQDRITGERTLLREIPAWKGKIQYMIGRNTPYFDLTVHKGCGK